MSYNAAGVLAHMASDGVAAWTVEQPSRDAVLERVAAAVQRWDLRAERNINYRSFEPILSLLHAHHTPQCQHWAVWALANLTTVYREYNCRHVWFRCLGVCCCCVYVNQGRIQGLEALEKKKSGDPQAHNIFLRSFSINYLS